MAALDGVSRRDGLLVVLDDLHWADADSLALLELVGRSLAGRRIAVIGTYRDAEAGVAMQPRWRARHAGACRWMGCRCPRPPS